MNKEEYTKLKGILNCTDELIKANVTCESPEFKAWRFKTKRFLTTCYGTYSEEKEIFLKTDFGIFNNSGELSEKIAECKKGLMECREMFKVYLEEFKPEDSTEIIKGAEETNESVREIPEMKELDLKRVFVVHGHDNALKQEVARIIEKQGLEAVILSEQANGGKTIIEKIEENSDVGAAICLFTGDDYGRAKGTEAEENKLRARQNVVFEAGYFMGKLGRGNVILIASPDIEIPSDLQGVVYTNKDMWQTDVLRELKAIGYNVDFNKLFA